MSGETAAPYRHISEPEEASETVSFGRRHRLVQPRVPPMRVCVAVVMALILLGSIVLLVVLAVRSSSGGGGGSGGNAASRKCSAFPAWNISERHPDSSVRRPPPRTYAVDVHYVHLAVMDHLRLSQPRAVNDSVDEYFRYRVPELLFTAQLLRHVPALGNASLHVQLTPELLSLYLACPPQSAFYCPTPTEQQQMVDAIAAGEVTFDAFPMTVESDLLDHGLLRWGLDWSARLAEETGRAGGHARTMVLTDVQGATRALVRRLNASAVDGLLLSTDERTRAFALPNVFRWKDEESGASTIALHQRRLYSSLDAEDAITVPGLNHALLVDRVSDINAPAISPALMLAHLEHVQAQFPSSVVLFSTVDEFMGQLSQHHSFGRVELPEVTHEIGSASVVGVASDPLLLSAFLNLRDLSARCVNDSDCDSCSRGFADFTRFLLAAAQPVQGVNVSGYLHPLQDDHSAYWQWSNAAFSAARDQPEVTALERSWQGSRGWSINRSLHALPDDHAVRTSFCALLNDTLIPPEIIDLDGLVPSTLLPGFDTGAAGYLVSFNTDGSTVGLIDKASGINYAGSANPLGLFLYQFLSEADYNASLAEFLSCGANGTVAACDAPTLLDYGKLGLDAAFTAPSAPNLSAYTTSHFYVQNDTTTPSTFLFNLSLPADLCALHTDVGAPSYAALRIGLSPGVLSINLTLYHVTTTRVPEASYLLFRPRPPREGANALQVQKVGQWVTEGEGAHVGNASVNTWGVRDARVDGYWRLHSDDAALMVRELTVLPVLQTADAEARAQSEKEVQVAVVLHTNAWSRDHAQWYPYDRRAEQRERNVHFRFTMRLM